MHPGPVALVTGASRGIGAATAVALARRGVHTILLARTQGGLEETDDAIRAAGGTATLFPHDLTEFAGVDALGPTIHQRFGRLDILVHAAATLGKLTPVGHILPKDWEATMALNLAATWRLIATTDPLLRLATAGRAVFLTDATPPRAYWGLYGASKAGMAHLVEAWALETQSTPLRICLHDPGPTATRLRAAAMPGEDAAWLQTAEIAGAAVARVCLPFP